MDNRCTNGCLQLTSFPTRRRTTLEGLFLFSFCVEKEVHHRQRTGEMYIFGILGAIKCVCCADRGKKKGGRIAASLLVVVTDKPLVKVHKIDVIMTRSSLFIVVLLGMAMHAVVQAFVHPPASMLRTSTSLNVLDNDTIGKLEEMRTKYMNMADDAPEKATMKDTVEKYTTYRETKAMMGRLRQMWRTEASERRRARQLKSFTELYDARLDMEVILKERLGAKESKSDEMKSMLDAIAKIDKEIAELETKYEKVKIVLPEGMSTRKERYGVGAEQRGITY